ncbi:MAG: YraN family protein [Patescibacteria group bacterium]|nr:YraN family protein [Patescibacteria group bacterium]MCL5257693.1 YraN family protein [Patescibacteria group bacterium]
MIKPAAAKLSTKSIGQTGEKLAEKFLVKKGFMILARNCWLKNFGEIDLICRRNRTTHFVEVKTITFKPGETFRAEDHFNSKKKFKLEKLISFYLNKNKIEEKSQLDLIAITINQSKHSAKIKHYQNV